MALNQPKYRLLRHLLMSFALLWAVLFHSMAAYAYDTSVPVVQQSHSTNEAQEQAESSDYAHDMQSGRLYLAQEGTKSTCPLNLHPANTNSKIHAITFASQRAVIPATARAPGGSFFCQFFYTSSQPQAP